jgi:cellulose synthase/poly-beta-1,6-N-acetylglucosamine synthase-like glycosyltransferase
VLTDWTHWLSSAHPEQLQALVLGLLLIDAPRYALCKIVLCLWDFSCSLGRWLGRLPIQPALSYCPSVGVVVAGHNEQETIAATLTSIWGSYPRLEIVVVDDGSTDGMEAEAQRFARTHDGVVVLRRPERGGKSSALNWGVAYTRAEVIVVVDADSDLGPSALWELVQPLQDPRVGAVAGAVLARNPFTGLVTWLQAYEYLSAIFVGRMVSAWLGILGIVSGAFGAFRRSALEQVMGWDVGPPEDLDLTLALRKCGYQIAFAPYAQCFTELPVTWWGLIRQRLRWDRSGAIRNHFRKHLDLAFVWRPHFLFSNFFVLLESWVFNVVCTYGIAVWFVCFFWNRPSDWWQILFTLYVCYLGLELIQVVVGLGYSNAPGRDAVISAVFFLVPFYQLLLLSVRLVATTEELFLRKSCEDNYVPARVRDATWRW